MNIMGETERGEGEREGGGREEGGRGGRGREGGRGRGNKKVYIQYMYMHNLHINSKWFPFSYFFSYHDNGN